MKTLHIHAATYNSYVAVLEALKNEVSRKEISKATNLSIKEVDNRLRILANIGAIQKIILSRKNVRYKLADEVKLIKSHDNEVIEDREESLYYGRKKRHEIVKDLKLGDKVEIVATYGKTENRATFKIIKGKVVDVKDDFFLIQTKNYKECFSWYELGKVVMKI